MDLSKYAAEAEEFLSSLTAEWRWHDAGLKEALELSAIYRQHQSLFAPGAVAELLADRSTPERRSLAEFAAFGWIENELREITEEIATGESRATVEWEGKAIPWYQAGIVTANEPDCARRHHLEARTVATTAQLNPRRGERLRRAHDAGRKLGFRDYVEMCEQLGQLNLGALSPEMQKLLDETRTRHLKELAARLAAAAIPREEATTADWSFLHRGREFDPMFPKEKLLPALVQTMAGLGINLDGQSNLKLDVEERPLKSPRAFCAPVRVPHEVWLVIRPHGGHDDYGSILHEAGHAEHFAHAQADAPFAFRYLGDNSVTEAYAFLFGNLTRNGEWLRDILGLQDVGGYLALAQFNEMYMLRRYAAKLGYESELHRSGDLESQAPRYSRLLGEAVGVRVWPENFLFDVDDGLYCARYLRAWMLEVQLRKRLEREFGPRWFTSAEAGEYLRGLWSLGQKLTAEEIAARLGYEGLEMGGLIGELMKEI
jgi:hypothetical protein